MYYTPVQYLCNTLSRLSRQLGASCPCVSPVSPLCGAPPLREGGGEGARARVHGCCYRPIRGAA